VQRIEGSRRTEDGPLRCRFPWQGCQGVFREAFPWSQPWVKKCAFHQMLSPVSTVCTVVTECSFPDTSFTAVQRRNPSLSACFVTLMSLRDSARLGVRLRAAKRVPVTCCEPLYRTQGAQGSSCVLSSNIHSQRQFALANTTSTVHWNHELCKC